MRARVPIAVALLQFQALLFVDGLTLAPSPRAVTSFQNRLPLRKGFILTRQVNSQVIRFAGDDLDEESDEAATGATDDKVATRETAEEAWEKAPEGSFLSPALLAALFLVGLCFRFFVIGV